MTVDGGDGGPHHTVTLDPADPGTLGRFSGEAGSWDSTGDPGVEADVVELPDVPCRPGADRRAHGW
ncbi:hypothetical protein ACQP2F_24310 [Actinoplanes sp. CA-030573]|uniref:hypothetical protein n=1 Tax=Actinoplanes sp. CA-030573 TaxID=3239898 RepID=UPI003D8F087C